MELNTMSSVKVQKVKSEIGYSYITIKITRSRINKGLLAIPVSLLERFPREKRKIAIFFDNEEKPSMKSFVPYTSSSKECRINGLLNWFVKNNIQDQDEIVVQFLDENKGIYRIFKETKFLEDIKILENKIKNAENDEYLEKYFDDLSSKVNQSKKEIAIVEFLRINNEILQQTLSQAVFTDPLGKFQRFF